MSSSWNLALVVMIVAAGSGCFGQSAPIAAKVTSMTLHDLQRMTLNVTITNEGDTQLEKIEVGFAPHLLDRHGATTSRTGTVRNHPHADWGSNFFGPDETLPPRSSRELVVEIDYQTSARAGDIYNIMIHMEAQDHSKRWKLTHDECWTTEGTAYTNDRCGTTFYHGAKDPE